MMGFFPVWLERVYKPGSIGVMTRSGSLTNEVTAQIVKAGFGTSTMLGVGGDATTFTRFAELYNRSRMTHFCTFRRCPSTQRSN